MLVTNISTYKFTPLSNLKQLRERLLGQCKVWGLKGTILLSQEGINLFVAGPREKIDLLLASLRAVPGLEDLAPKVSENTYQPFTRMLVRIKKEIISFGVEGIAPGQKTSPKLSAAELKKWLDEGRPVTLLDTRNDYEVKLGAFNNAKVLDIDHFRDFPRAVRELPEDLKKQPIVMYCTGGIRCEKAGPFMEQEGFEQIYQLDGGILKYFEEVGSDHYNGECFVFDKRVGVDPSLQETQDSLCFICLSPLNLAEQKDSRYVVGESCPYCFKTSEELMRLTIAKRHAAIAALTSSLPGSEPCQNIRPLSVAKAFDGKTLVEFLCHVFPHIAETEWRRQCLEGLFLNSKNQTVNAEQVVRAGELYSHLMPKEAEPDVSAKIEIIYEDEALVVVNKPAPLPVHPSGRFNRNTLQYILNNVYAPQVLRPAHRLDSDTTGVLVLARTKHFARLLQTQFMQQGVKKTYLARVIGHPTKDEFSCELPIDDQDAQTHFRVLERLSDGTSFVEAFPITGRTNQIRIHLWALGNPICGDKIFLPNQERANAETHSPGDEPLCLHAAKIEFVHPITKKWVKFEVVSFPESEANVGNLFNQQYQPDSYPNLPQSSFLRSQTALS